LGSGPNVDSYRLIVSRSPEFQVVVIDQRLSGTRLHDGNFASEPITGG